MHLLLSRCRKTKVYNVLATIFFLFRAKQGVLLNLKNRLNVSE